MINNNGKTVSVKITSSEETRDLMEKSEDENLATRQEQLLFARSVECLVVCAMKLDNGFRIV